MKLFEIHESYTTKLVQLLRTAEPDMIDDLAVIFNTYGINIYAPVEEIEQQLQAMDTGETRESPVARIYSKVKNYMQMGV